MTISIVKIEFSLSVHATEDFDKNMVALANLIPEEIIQESEIVVENLEGGYAVQCWFSGSSPVQIMRCEEMN